jgi:hypothetical protein
MKPESLSLKNHTSIRILGGNRNAFRPNKIGWKLTDRLATASSIAELDALEVRAKEAAMASAKTLRRWQKTAQETRARLLKTP